MVDKDIDLVNVYIKLMTATPALPRPPDEVVVRFETDLYRWFDPIELDDLFDIYKGELWL